MIRRSTRRRVWIGLFLFTLVLINYMDRVALSVAAKPIAAAFALSPATMGYLFSSFLWTYVLCLIPIGMAVDRLGTKRVIGGGIAIWSLATMATGLATGFVPLLATRLVMGGAEATTYPAAIRVIRDWFPQRERGVVTAAFNGGSSAGPAVGALATGLLLTLFDWQTTFLCLGAVGLLWFAVWQVYFAVPEQCGWLDPAERAAILAERHGGETVAVTAWRSSSIPHLLRQRTIWGLLLSQSCTVYTSYLLLTWLPSYLQAARDLTQLSTGVFTALPYLVTTALSLLIARVSDRVLSPNAVRGGQRRLFVAGVSMLCTLILLAPSAASAAALMAVMALVLTGSITASAVNLALANDLLRNPRDASRVAGLMVFGGNSCGLLAPIVTGHIIAATGGYTWAFRVAAALAVCSAVVTLTMTRRPIAPETPARVVPRE
jgi:ACS family glucarate transporter-like MFS transporter